MKLSFLAGQQFLTLLKHQNYLSEGASDKIGVVGDTAIDR